jgi:hypothetical protein
MFRFSDWLADMIGQVEKEIDMKLTPEQELTMKMAQVGYESYAAYTGNKSAVTGDDLPTWEQLPGVVVNAWFAAAEGMTNFLASIGPVEITD